MLVLVKLPHQAVTRGAFAVASVIANPDYWKKTPGNEVEKP
jgi:hypothetical protein